MKVISFIRDTMGLRPVEVEVSLTPGLPRIQFLGLPDIMIKESVLRIQSALKHCGYKLPKAKQVLVQLKPNYLKKSSRGLDLAVASAILWETEQEPKPDFVETVALYGELSLKGEVSVPDDFEDLIDLPPVDRFFTGPKMGPQSFDLYALEKLSDLKNATFVPKKDLTQNFIRPLIPNIFVTPEQAELLTVIAVGEHPTIFAGPPGTGKTTMASLVTTFLKDPEFETFRISQKISRHFGIPLNFRPIVMPHHTSTALAMIGGGSTPHPGEITRAHGGALIMDEFLEFDPAVQEALREPMETGQMTVARGGAVQIYPARFLLLATTNLCSCGYLIPERNFECKGRIRFCHSRLQKMSGPMIDRFSILSLSHLWGKRGKIPVQEVFLQIQKVQKFILESRGQKRVNHFLNNEEIECEMRRFDLEALSDVQEKSFRRYQSLLKVARSLADCELSRKITADHIEKARALTLTPFQLLRDFTFKY